MFGKKYNEMLKNNIQHWPIYYSKHSKVKKANVLV